MSRPPKYLQVKKDIEQRLASPDFDGRKFLSERELCELYGVSRPTVRHALKLLAQEGLLVTESRRGSFSNNLPGNGPKSGLTIAVLSQMGLSERQDPYNHELFAGIEERLTIQEALPIYVPVIHNCYRRFDFSTVAGTVVARVTLDWSVLLERRNMPLVFAGENPSPYPGAPAADAVFPDNMENAKAAVRYLLSLGHRRIACITGAIRDRPSDAEAVERLEGFLAAQKEGGVTPSDALIRRGNWTSESGYEAARQLLDIPDGPTAIFAANDDMAIGAVRAVVERGLDVPRDVSVIGHDNIETAPRLCPPLTTMDVRFRDIGRMAAQMLIERMANPAIESRHKKIQGGLMLRDTCAAPSAHD